MSIKQNVGSHRRITHDKFHRSKIQFLIFFFLIISEILHDSYKPWEIFVNAEEPALASIMTHDHAKDLCASDRPLKIQCF